ncbi:esterase/lipase family protein [Streptomyces sp. H39-S7]|uniref:esterase/lipase family protein n=1 Tax=Streptomyces sp. H39-S7 TaxID=3004357 RepID=UPI0022AFA9BC|nr:alpha/beta fold hydrolase [Streptomyces sp. H39-S7]MCZ4119785.1 alpha/beta fold hydrolase [Streptomyces sp. H39-S7]
MRLTRRDRGDRPPVARRRTWIASAAAATALALLVAAPSATASTPAYPVGDLGTAVSNFLLSPDAVAGANGWHCTPSPQHPTPVVLVHATFVDLGANWAVLSPTLANEGYCVYAFNYGMNWLSAGRIGGLGDIPQSARTLQSFVDTVLRRTGASKVDLVGHSQGGLMPNYYLKRLGGAAKVGRFVALAPSNHGTTLNGIVTLGQNLNALGFANNVLSLLQLPGLVQQEQGSAFEQALFRDGDTVPGPRYTVIETNKDTVVTPYTHAFLSGPAVRNILIQDQCADDPVGHVGMFADSPTLQNVLNALGADDPAFRATCSGYGLPL